MSAVTIERHGHIAVITLNRPEQRNAFNYELRDELANAQIEFAGDDDLWVAIFTGNGTAFSAGADLKEQSARLAEGLPPLVTVESEDRVPQHWKPTIAAINGPAYGRGLSLTLDCDIRIASTNATLGITEAKWNLMPMPLPRLARLIPPGVAYWMALTATSISAEEAYNHGLVVQLTTPEELMVKAMATAEQICGNGPLAVREVKRLFYSTQSASLEAAQALCNEMYAELRKTEDATEGPRAFAERRKPRWKLQ